MSLVFYHNGLQLAAGFVIYARREMLGSHFGTLRLVVFIVADHAEHLETLSELASYIPE